MIIWLQFHTKVWNSYSCKIVNFYSWRATKTLNMIFEWNQHRRALSALATGELQMDETLEPSDTGCWIVSWDTLILCADFVGNFIVRSGGGRFCPIDAYVCRVSNENRMRVSALDLIAQLSLFECSVTRIWINFHRGNIYRSRYKSLVMDPPVPCARWSVPFELSFEGQSAEWSARKQLFATCRIK